MPKKKHKKKKKPDKEQKLLVGVKVLRKERGEK